MALRGAKLYYDSVELELQDIISDAFRFPALHNIISDGAMLGH
jgi:hypothetical protein